MFEITELNFEFFRDIIKELGYVVYIHPKCGMLVATDLELKGFYYLLISHPALSYLIRNPGCKIIKERFGHYLFDR